MQIPFRCDGMFAHTYKQFTSTVSENEKTFQDFRLLHSDSVFRRKPTKYRTAKFPLKILALAI